MNDINKQSQPPKSPLEPVPISREDIGVNSNNNVFLQAPPLGGWGVCGMDIKVLGTGCPKCKSLEKVTREAVAEAGIDATVSKVEDIVEIMSYSVMTTPALVINGKVVIKGRVPSVDEIKSLITK